MNTEKNITICGKDVKIRYCAATETGFERLAEKSISEIDFSKQEDLIRLAMSAVIAAYERDGQEAPITSKDILFDAKPDELIELFKSVLELRVNWYNVPIVVKPEMEERDGDKKN